MIGLSTKTVCYDRFGKKFLKVRKSAKNAQFWPKCGVFEALYLMIKASYHLFDTFPT